jgi:hypothetical protein
MLSASRATALAAPTARVHALFGKPGLVSPGAVSNASATGAQAAVQDVGKEKPVKPKRIKKANPAVAAAARELRDRWMERLNDAAPALPCGKYDLLRAASAQLAAEPVRLLAA